MSLENYGSIWAIDHCYSLSKTNLSKEKDIFIYTTWNKSRPTFINESCSKAAKINHRLYLMQANKAKYFEKLFEKKEKSKNTHK